jgi:sporulation protein YlmC with PRC-barrel domain
MLKSAAKMQGYKLLANDGDIGKVNTFLFNDESWEIMYLVADTGNWLIDRLVLVSPVALRQLKEDEDKIPVNLTKEQIENSPPISEHEPVSRQYEQQLFGYYRWPVYWNAGAGYYPFAAGYPDTAPPMAANIADRMKEEPVSKGDLHLRSTREVKGYNIQAADGEIGHVEDFIIDDATWEIRYIIVDTKNWLPGKKVILSPKWINKIEWPESKVHINFTKEKIENSPEYKSEEDINRNYEVKLFDHYDRKGYW